MRTTRLAFPSGAMVMLILIALDAWGRHAQGEAGDFPPPPSLKSGEKPVLAYYSYEVIRAWPHDPAAFTQGLVFYEGDLLESTGLNGQSTLRDVELDTGRVLK